MIYGGPAYGSTGYGSKPGNNLQVFLPFSLYSANSFTSRTVDYKGSAQFYEINVFQTFETFDMEYRVYTHDDPFETPQLQVILGGSLNTQAIIGAHKFITVELTVGGSSVVGTRVTGREYFQ